MDVDQQSILKVAKYKCMSSLLFFTRYMFMKSWGKKYTVAEPHQKIAEVLEQVIAGKITRLIINVPVRYGKTELAVINFIAHCLALNPAAKFIHLTYSDSLALDNSEHARELVMSPGFQELFPVKIKSTSKAKEKWYTEQGGGVYATATGGQVTGFGAGAMPTENKGPDEETLDEFLNYIQRLQARTAFAGAIIIDDPQKPEDAYSELRRRRVNERFESTIRSRANSRTTPIIVIQQRTHAQDLSGYLMDTEPGVWTVVKLPALKEDGTALWEAKHTVAELYRLKRINEYVFDSQYQQAPSKTKKGGEFLWNFNYTQHVRKVIRDVNLPIHVTMDSNVYPYITIAMWQIKLEASQKTKIRQIGELPAEDPDNTVTAAAKKLVTWLKLIQYDDVIYLYGDKSTKNRNNIDDDKRSFFRIFMETLQNAGYVVEDKILSAPSSVGTVCAFTNEVLSPECEWGEIEIEETCHYSIGDYQNTKRDENGSMVKTRVRHPKLEEVTYEENGHFTDSFKDFLVQAFNRRFEDFKNRHKKLKPMAVAVSRTPKVTH
jgi:hypothetical protein